LTRPIGLLIPRSPTMTPTISDASYDGLGGWALEHPCIWHLSKQDMESCGFTMPQGKEPEQEKEDKQFDHINVLEFVAVILNIWVAVRYLMLQPIRNAHIIMNILADNTSALSWMQHAARTKRPAVRNLARFLQALLTHCPLPIRLQGKHLPGKKHIIADLLSRFLLAPSWGSVIEQTSPTLDCS